MTFTVLIDFRGAIQYIYIYKLPIGVWVRDPNRGTPRGLSHLFENGYAVYNKYCEFSEIRAREKWFAVVAHRAFADP